MILKQDLLPVGCPARPGIALQSVFSITIHWIGPYPNQAVDTPRAWWVKSGLQASAHYIVKDADVLQCIPTSEVAWHCGSKGNYTSLGIEVVPASIQGEFSETSIATLKELLGTLPHVELRRHYDWTGKDCPLWYTPLSDGGEDRWNKLREELTWQQQ
jgi:N-acetylmuramoyl-L-alanine amidase CwlA